MPQYLLSIYQPDGGTPPPEFLEEVGRKLHVLNQEIKAAGAWVFTRRAARPEHRHGGAAPRQGHGDDRRPLHRRQGAHRRVLGRQGAGPRRGARLGAQGGARRSHRCRSRCARSRTTPGTDPGLDEGAAAEIERVFRAEYGRAVAVLVRVFGDIDVAEDAVADAFTAAVERWPSGGNAAEPGRLDHHHRSPPRDRPAASRGVARRPARPGGPAARARTSRSRRAPVQDERLRLIFTCCHPALGRGAQVALTLRLLGGLSTGGDRAGLPGARADDGAATGASQGQDPRRPDPVPRATRGRAREPAAVRCWPSSISCSTRATRRARAMSSCARSCAPRPSAWAACSSS